MLHFLQSKKSYFNINNFNIVESVNIFNLHYCKRSRLQFADNFGFLNLFLIVFLIKNLVKAVNADLIKANDLIIVSVKIKSRDNFLVLKLGIDQL